jgi:hypothetical protein
VLAGIAAFAPAVAFLVAFGEDAGYFVFIAMASTLICSAVVGTVWGIVTLVRRPGTESNRHWQKPALILVPSVVVLGFIMGASFNSYRESLGPPGDHSVANASASTRALWIAAKSGDVREVARLTAETCADPWVKFPVGDGRHNAKGMAEERELQVDDDREAPFREVAHMLGDYMDRWEERCDKDAS